MTSERVVVIGAGIIGLATAREIRHRHPDAAGHRGRQRVPRWRPHQTSHNSGVVHAGLYYQPGSLKARLCTQGRQLLQDFCAAHDLPYEECGKVVVARTTEEVPALREIEARARANGVPGLRWLSGGGAAGRSSRTPPGVAALHSPHTAIVDFTRVAQALAAELDVRLGLRGDRARSAAGAEVVITGPAGEIGPIGWSSAPACRPTGWPAWPATGPGRPSCRSGASTGG